MAARTVCEFGAVAVAKLECAEVALHQPAVREPFAAAAADVVQHGRDEDDREAEAGINEEQFVEIEAEHAITSVPQVR